MHLRVFISSPGDVLEERALAQQVVEQELPKDPLLRGSLTCEAVRWDDPAAPAALPATLTPQAAIAAGLPRPSECDVVVVILWSRLGTPLPPDHLRPDGSRYLSGTEWEFEEALHAAQQPCVLVYRRKSKVEIDPDDEKADEKNEQISRVRRFLKQFRNEDGSLKAGFAEYEMPQQFRDRLRVDLRNYLQQKLARHAGGARVPPPYRAIARALAGGRLVPFIGSDAAHSGRLPGVRWDPAAPQFLPSGEELSRLLADESSFPAESDRDHLAEVASYYEVAKTRPVLRDRLQHFFGARAPGQGTPPLHALMASTQTPLLIVTTCFDTQLERAFHDAGRPYDLVVYPADRKDLGNAVLWWEHGAPAPTPLAPNLLDVNPKRRTVIFKMHGTIVPDRDEWDGVVITESDNVEFLARVGSRGSIPHSLATHIKERGLLFLGFPLRDWSSRTILRGLKWGAGRDDDESLSLAVAEQFSRLEAELWARRGVVTFEMALDDFATSLRKEMP